MFCKRKQHLSVYFCSEISCTLGCSPCKTLAKSNDSALYKQQHNAETHAHSQTNKHTLTITCKYILTYSKNAYVYQQTHTLPKYKQSYPHLCTNLKIKSPTNINAYTYELRHAIIAQKVCINTHILSSRHNYTQRTTASVSHFFHTHIHSHTRTHTYTVINTESMIFR